MTTLRVFSRHCLNGCHSILARQHCNVPVYRTTTSRLLRASRAFSVASLHETDAEIVGATSTSISTTSTTPALNSNTADDTATTIGSIDINSSIVHDDALQHFILTSHSSDQHNLEGLNCIPSNQDGDVTNTLASLATSGVHVPAYEVAWWDPSIYVCDVVHTIHDMTGWNYAASIASITIAGRLLLLPVGIWHLRNNPWEPQIARLVRLMKKSNTLQGQRGYAAQIRTLQGQFPSYNRYILPASSIGATLFIWIGLRRMSSLYAEDMVGGGASWFLDLTQPDPYLFLPILSTFLMFTSRQLGADELGRPSGKIENKALRYAVNGWTGVLFFVWFTLPSSMMCFWIPHSALACIQAVILSQPPVIRALGFGGSMLNVAPVHFDEPNAAEPKYFKDGDEAGNASTTANDKQPSTSTDAPSSKRLNKIRLGRRQGKGKGQRR